MQTWCVVCFALLHGSALASNGARPWRFELKAPSTKSGPSAASRQAVSGIRITHGATERRRLTEGISIDPPEARLLEDCFHASPNTLRVSVIDPLSLTESHILLQELFAQTHLKRGIPSSVYGRALADQMSLGVGTARDTITVSVESARHQRAP